MHYYLGIGDNIYPIGAESADDKIFVENWLNLFIEPCRALRVPWYLTLGTALILTEDDYDYSFYQFNVYTMCNL